MWLLLHIPPYNKKLNTNCIAMSMKNLVPSTPAILQAALKAKPRREKSDKVMTNADGK